MTLPTHAGHTLERICIPPHPIHHFMISRKLKNHTSCIKLLPYLSLHISINVRGRWFFGRCGGHSSCCWFFGRCGWYSSCCWFFGRCGWCRSDGKSKKNFTCTRIIKKNSIHTHTTNTPHTKRHTYHHTITNIENTTIHRKVLTSQKYFHTKYEHLILSTFDKYHTQYDIPPLPQRSHPRHTHRSTKYHKIIPLAIRPSIKARSHYTYHLRSSTLQPPIP